MNPYVYIDRKEQEKSRADTYKKMKKKEGTETKN